METNNQPIFKIIFGQEGRNDKTYWTKLGAAWETKKGGSYNLKLDFIPNTEGQMILVPFESKDQPISESELNAAIS